MKVELKLCIFSYHKKDFYLILVFLGVILFWYYFSPSVTADNKKKIRIVHQNMQFNKLYFSR